MNTTISKLRNYAHRLRKWYAVLSIGHRVIELCLLLIILPVENCIPMTRNALYIEAVGRRANNVLLPNSIQAWNNDCWSNKVIEEQLDQRQIPPSKLEQYCMGCWPGLITVRFIPQRLNSHQRHIPRGTFNSTARVAYRANG